MGKRLPEVQEDILEDSAPESAEPVENEVETLAEPEPSTAKVGESVEDSVRAAIKKEQEKQVSGSEGQTPEKPSGSLSGQSAPNEKPEAPPLEENRDLEAPASLSAKEKALFNKLPKELKPSVARLFKDAQGRFTRGQQDLANRVQQAAFREQEASHLVQALQPLYTSNPELAKRGVTLSQFAASLGGTYANLTNPETDWDELKNIAASRGYRIAKVDDHGNALPDSASARVNGYDHQQNQDLNDWRERVDNYLVAQEIKAASEPILNELRSVQQERDAAGNFVYPELQSRQFIQYAKQLVSAEIGKDPSLSYGNALRKVTEEARKQFGYSPSATTAKLPSVNNQNNRAVRAATTVRGGIAPPTVASRIDSKPSKYEPMETSVRTAIERYKRGEI